jgi:signal transduction histidine kinase
MSAASEPDHHPTSGGRGLGDPAVREVVKNLGHLAVFGYNAAGAIIFWNRGCERLLGHAAVDVMEQQLATVLGTTPTRQADVVDLRHRNGAALPVLLHHVAPSAGGDAFAVVTPLAGSVSGPAGLDEQILRSQKLESLGVLAGGIAHDFNNLLLGVVGNADLVLMELDADHPARPSVEQIAQAGLRAADLCRQLLAFSGKGQVLVEPMDLSRLVQDLAPLMHMSLGGARLQLDLADGLPDVEADSTQVRQVVMNLVTNAAEAQEEKPGLIRIRTFRHDAERTSLEDPVTGQALPTGTYVGLEIRDDGVGMPPDQQERIFEPFFTTKFMGRGLGLAAVQGIVRAHHGAITVTSSPDSGSAFAVYLPTAGLRSALAMSRPAAAAAAQPAPAERSTHHVLVVDDEQHVRNVASQLLEAAGYVVTCVEDGDLALEVLHRDLSAFDLVLLDMTMPRVGGLEVLEQLRQFRPDLPVLLSSGYGPEKVGDVLNADPACGFIQKPYRREDLLDHAEAMLA